MNRVMLTINGQNVDVPSGTSILEAARQAGIYISTLCYRPDLPPGKGSEAVALIYQGDRKIENSSGGERAAGCGLCLVGGGRRPCRGGQADSVLGTAQDREQQRRHHWDGTRALRLGGDVAAVPGAIIHSIAAGRKAASSIDKALGAAVTSRRCSSKDGRRVIVSAVTKALDHGPGKRFPNST